MGLRVFVPSAADLLTDHRGNGEGLIAWQLLSGLAARGVELVVCAREADLQADPPFELVITGASRFSSLDPVAHAVRARRELKRRGPFDVVHWLFPQRPDQAIFVPPRGTPSVIGPLATEWPAGAVRRPRRLGDAVRVALGPSSRRRHRRVLRRSLVLLATPEAARAGAAGSRLVPFGLDLAPYAACEAKPGRDILFLGRLERSKGVRDLVQAFAAVHARRPQSTLVLAGEGPESSWITEARERLRLNGSVEAMAAGRAVVAASAPGPRLLVDDPRGGRIVAPGDTAGLAHAIEDVLADDARLEAMGRFNRARVQRDLTLEHTLDALEAAYAEVCR